MMAMPRNSRFLDIDRILEKVNAGSRCLAPQGLTDLTPES
jgi:hypothetical protein